MIRRICGIRSKSNCQARPGPRTAGKSVEIPRHTESYANERSHRSGVQFNLRIPRRSAETTRFAETTCRG